MELPGDDTDNMVDPERRGLSVARQLEELANDVKDEDEKVDIWIFEGFINFMFKRGLAAYRDYIGKVSRS